MKRISLIFLTVAAVALVANACAQNGFEPIAVTKSPSVVSSCQKIDDVKIEDVKADEKLSDVEAQQQLTIMAREKGANYLLVSDDSARQGTAYRCSMPATSAPSGSR